MKRQILKRLISSVAATTLAVTSLGLDAVLGAGAVNVPQAESKNPTDNASEQIPAYTHTGFNTGSCSCCGYSGKGVTIALLDAGVTEFETTDNVSFIDDDTVGSSHGNDMMSVINNIAPDADVLDVRVLNDEGQGTYSDVEKGIRWSVENNADIIVMSFVGSEQTALLENALAYAEENNVLVVAAAGNYSDNKALYPAAYPTVISVGALDENGNLQNYSNYGDFVDTYVEWDDGTSGAAQYIAASAAVSIEQNPGISVSELRAPYMNPNKPQLEPSGKDNADAVVYAAASHTHNYTKFKMTAKAATCTTDGVAIYGCSYSGCTSTTNKTIKAYGHSWGSWSTTSSATCTSPAKQSRTCSRCSKKETQTVGSALGHSYTVFKMTAQAATCTTNGTAIYGCSHSGCTSTTNKTINAYGHNWGSWETTSNATCTAAEVQTRKCSRGCKESQSVGSPLGHNYSWNVTKEPTCEVTGSRQYKCTRCGNINKTETLDALGHDYKFKQTAKPATCTTDGVDVYVCSRCSKSDNRTVKAYGHSWGDWKTSTAATCTAPETQTRTCSRGCKDTREYGSPLGHNYQFKLTAKAATCTTDGVAVYVCSRCEDSQNQTIKAYGHDWGEWKTTTPATCTEAAVQTRVCSRGCKETRSYGTIPGHDYKWVVTKEATCEATGSRQYKCTKCSKVDKTETLPALGHDYKLKQTAKPATCTTDGVDIYVCSRCSKSDNKTVKAYGHSWGDWTVTSAATCTAAEVQTRVCSRCKQKENKTIGSPLGHDFKFKLTAKAATCTTDGVGIYVCSRCETSDEKVIKAYGHDWGDWKTTTPATCTAAEVQTRVCSRGCKETQNVGSPLGHDFKFKLTAKAATCTTDGVGIYVCSRCETSDERVIKAYGHDWGEWKTAVPANCTEAEIQTRVCSRGCKETQTVGSPLGHDFQFKLTAKAATCTTDGVALYVCPRCTAAENRTIKAPGHDWGEWKKTADASCTAGEIYTRICSRGCKETKEEGKPLGHDFQFKMTAKAATCTTDGVGIYVCTRCQASENRAITAPGHDFKWVVTKAATCEEDGLREYKCQRSGCGKVEKSEKIIAPGHDFQFKMTAKAATCTTDGVGIYVCTKCDASENRTITAPGHDFKWVVTKAATCEEDGLREYKCQRSGCGKVDKSEKIITPGHDYQFKITAKPATCTTDGVGIWVCKNCSGSENRTIKAPGHAMGEWEVKTPATKTKEGVKVRKCTNSGCTYTEEEAIPVTGNISVEDCGFSTFSFAADGTLEEGTHSWTLYNGGYLILTFEANDDWTVSASDFVQVLDTNYHFVSSGNKGTNTILVKCKEFPSTSYDISRDGTLTLKVNDTTKTYNIFQSNYKINSLEKTDYVAQSYVQNYAGQLGAGSLGAKALRGESLSNAFYVLSLDAFRTIAISIRKVDQKNIKIEYAVFKASLSSDSGSIECVVALQDTNGLKLSNMRFSTYALINDSYAHVKDEIYASASDTASFWENAVNTVKSFVIGFIPLSPVNSFAVDGITGAIIEGGGNFILNSIYQDNGNNSVIANSTVTLNNGCSFCEPGNDVYVYAHSTSNAIARSNSSLYLSIVDSAGRSTPFVISR